MPQQAQRKTEQAEHSEHSPRMLKAKRVPSKAGFGPSFDFKNGFGPPPLILKLSLAPSLWMPRQAQRKTAQVEHSEHSPRVQKTERVPSKAGFAPLV